MNTDLNQLASKHVTHLGAAIAVNRWLVSVIAVLVVVVLAQAVLNLRTAGMVENFRPLVVGLDAKGRPVATSYDDAMWKADAEAVRVYLANFVELHYRLVRRTMANDRANAMLFLEPAVSRAEESREATDDSLARFQNDMTLDEVEVSVKNVALDDFSAEPYRATIDFEKVFLVSGQGRERRRESWTAKVHFGLLDETPNWMLRVNLPGVLITKLDVFQAFTP